MAKKRVEGRSHSVMQASWKLLEALAEMQKYGESYEDVVWRLICSNAKCVCDKVDLDVLKSKFPEANVEIKVKEKKGGEK